MPGPYFRLSQAGARSCSNAICIAVIVRFVVLLGLFWSYRLVDTRARANNINLAELSLRNLEHPLELDPVNHISLLEDNPCGPGLVLIG